MRNSLKHFLSVSIFIWLLFSPFLVKADITFPARLEITEVAPGIYEVFFVLPVINGKVLSAQPVFPETFTILNEPTIDGDSNTKRMRWRISCNPEKIAGSRVGISGILGSPTDIFFKLTLANGRRYETKLNPSNAYYVIPSPPTYISLVKKAFSIGIYRVLTSYEFYFLIFILLPFFTTKSFQKLLVAFSFFSLLGLILGVKEVLVFSKHHFVFILLLISVLSAIKLLKKQKIRFKKLETGFFSALLGLAFGAILSTYTDLEGFTVSETSIYAVAICLGVLVGLFLLFFMLKEFVLLLTLLLKERTETIIGYSVGILAFGLLVFESSLYFTAPSMLPRLPIVLILFVLVSSFVLKKINGINSITKIILFLVPLATGISLGFLGIQIPYAMSVLLACIWFLFLSYFFKTLQEKHVVLPIIIVAGILAGTLFAEFTRDSLSFALGQTAGYTIILLLFFSSTLSLTVESNLKKSKIIKISIAFVVLLGLLLVWYQTFSNDMLQSLHTDFTLGIIHIPILSILSIFMVWIAWPRYKKIHVKMGLARKKPILSYLFLGLALLLVPISVKASNPWHVFKEPTQAEVQQITQRLLANTYKAFNLKNETQLFNVLSNNLEGSLVDNVYLDSRRRLTMGLKEGAEVSVETVSVLNIDERLPSEDTKTLFKYPAAWSVTARVRHLQHVHYRQNKYLGEITLKVIDNEWKISNITLTSEDRTIISANNK